MQSFSGCAKSPPRCHRGPGYGSPQEAMTRGPRESLLFVTCVRVNKEAPDYLATVDVDPESPKYGTVIARTEMTHLSDEVHHSGWNTCSSCHDDSSKCRNRLILPCLNSDRIYVVAVEQRTDTAQYETSLVQTIEPQELHALGVSAPHTTHCLPNGKLMVSCLGDENGDEKGTFLLIDAPTKEKPRFAPSALWNQVDVPFGYDYWYQPKHDVLVSTEWGAPKAFKQGFRLEDLNSVKYGSSIHFWQWSSGKLLQTLDLKSISPDTSMPLEVRFLHDPEAIEGYVGCALSGNVFRFYRQPVDGKWAAEEVIRIASKSVSGWSMSQLPALITDILISLDDRFLYISAWAFGEIRQYDIAASRSSPPLTGVVRIGGTLADPNVKLLHDPEQNLVAENQIFKQVKDVTLQAGAQMLQLSLDGRRLYVTNSLHSAWDRQFYPGVIDKGSQLLKIDVNTRDGGMAVDETFVVDFGKEPKGPALAHEMRYPGGDCTSDIWI